MTGAARAETACARGRRAQRESRRGAPATPSREEEAIAGAILQRLVLRNADSLDGDIAAAPATR